MIAIANLWLVWTLDKLQICLTLFVGNLNVWGNQWSASRSSYISCWGRKNIWSAGAESIRNGQMSLTFLFLWSCRPQGETQLQRWEKPKLPRSRERPLIHLWILLRCISRVNYKVFRNQFFLFLLIDWSEVVGSLSFFHVKLLTLPLASRCLCWSSTWKALHWSGQSRGNYWSCLMLQGKPLFHLAFGSYSLRTYPPHLLKGIERSVALTAGSELEKPWRLATMLSPFLFTRQKTEYVIIQRTCVNFLHFRLFTRKMPEASATALEGRCEHTSVLTEFCWQRKHSWRRTAGILPLHFCHSNQGFFFRDWSVLQFWRRPDGQVTAEETLVSWITLKSWSNIWPLICVGPNDPFPREFQWKMSNWRKLTGIFVWNAGVHNGGIHLPPRLYDNRPEMLHVKAQFVGPFVQDLCNLFLDLITYKCAKQVHETPYSWQCPVSHVGNFCRMRLCWSQGKLEDSLRMVRLLNLMAVVFASMTLCIEDTNLSALGSGCNSIFQRTGRVPSIQMCGLELRWSFEFCQWNVFHGCQILENLECKQVFGLWSSLDINKNWPFQLESHFGMQSDLNNTVQCWGLSHFSWSAQSVFIAKNLCPRVQGPVWNSTCSLGYIWNTVHPPLGCVTETTLRSQARKRCSVFFFGLNGPKALVNPLQPS